MRSWAVWLLCTAALMACGTGPSSVNSLAPHAELQAAVPQAPQECEDSEEVGPVEVASNEGAGCAMRCVPKTTVLYICSDLLNFAVLPEIGRPCITDTDCSSATTCNWPASNPTCVPRFGKTVDILREPLSCVDVDFKQVETDRVFRIWPLSVTTYANTVELIRDALDERGVVIPNYDPIADAEGRFADIGSGSDCDSGRLMQDWPRRHPTYVWLAASDPKYIPDL